MTVLLYMYKCSTTVCSAVADMDVMFGLKCMPSLQWLMGMLCGQI